MKLYEDREKLLRLADDLLSEKCPSVTDFRAPDPEAGIHDYYSEGGYWHPDPSKPDGKPYIRKDGVMNMNMFVKHKDMLSVIKRAASILYWAYQETRDMKYIEKMKDFFYTFFIDPEKYVNPSLDYSQAIQGICHGRSIGIIDFNQLSTVPLMLRYLEENNLVDEEFSSKLEEWCSAYSMWLETSEFGHTESIHENNHAIAFYLQYAAFSIFRPDWKEVRERISNAFKNQLLLQMAEDGSMPEEMKRARALWYSIYAIDLLVTLAKLISTPEDNLMEYEDEKGRSVRKAVYFIAPFMKDKSTWPLPPDVERWEKIPLGDTFLYIAGKEYGDESLIELFNELPEAIGQELEIERNVAIFVQELVR